MASDEVVFLRDEVQRLNDVLSEYQGKYPPSVPKDRGRDLPDLPWRTDKTLLCPLIAQYDILLAQATESVDQASVKALREQMQKLVAENDRLRRELRETVQNQLEAIPVETRAPTVGGESDLPLQNLQHQLQTVKQEKDAIEDMWRTSALEVERLEAILQNARSDPTLQEIETQASQIKSQYMATVNELNVEIDSLQGDLRRTKGELNVSQLQVTELRRTLEDLRLQLIQQEQEREIVSGSKVKSDSHVGDLAHRLAAAQSSLDSTAIELEQTKKDRLRLQEQVGDLQKRVSENEQKQYEAMLQVRDSVQMVENAMLEKDQAIQREKQTAEDMQKLEGSMATLMDEAGARTRQEVDNVKKQCNHNLSRLMEEIHTLEMENTEKQAHIDRAIREKRSAESELEKVHEEGVLRGNKESGAYDELTRRACNAERSRDESFIKLQANEAATRRMQMTIQQEKIHLQTELDQLKERLELMNTEYAATSDERVRLVEQMDEMKKTMTLLKQERDGAVRTKTKEVTCLENDLRLREIEYEARIQALDDSHRHAMMDIRQMLASQQRMSAKWKEECQTITQKFDVKINDLRTDLSRERKRTQELTTLLRDSKTKTADVEQMLAEYSHNIKRMEERVREAENRASTAHMQIGRQLRKDRNIIEERRQMQRQLERSLAESKISTL